jgi:RNA polymerase sigma-70 factor (ECF subfamily)
LESTSVDEERQAMSREATSSTEAGQISFSVAEAQRPRIFRFLLASLRDPDLAETLTQDCYLKAYSNWMSFRGESSVTTWLMRIAINLQKDHWRSKKMRFWTRLRNDAVDLDEASRSLSSRQSSPEYLASLRQQLHTVWQVLDRLTEQQRVVFLLHFVEELTFKEIAGATGVQEGTAKSHLYRAREKVRAALARQGSPFAKREYRKATVR